MKNIYPSILRLILFILPSIVTFSGCGDGKGGGDDVGEEGEDGIEVMDDGFEPEVVGDDEGTDGVDLIEDDGFELDEVVVDAEPDDLPPDEAAADGEDVEEEDGGGGDIGVEDVEHEDAADAGEIVPDLEDDEIQFDGIDVIPDIVEEDPAADEAEIIPECGNGEPEEGEECDDGNSVEGDGCDNDCTWSCHDHGECDDDDACNGFEACNPGTHMCEPGDPQDDGFVCETDPRSICLDGVCFESVCGDGFVDTGGGESCEPPGEGVCGPDCGWLCEGDGDCPDDGDICNGEEYCDIGAHECARRNPLDDGTVCGADPRMICLAQSCEESVCGDMFVDAGMAEDCEDGNDIDGDGCDSDCTWSCHDNDECDDEDACNGDETCNLDAHMCEPGDPPEDGYVCAAEPRSICLDGECVESICGDGFIDTGGGESCEPPGDGGCGFDCGWLCDGDGDCPDDGDICNGEEYCNMGAHECDRRNPLDDGTVCGADPRMICLARACGESVCGDGYFDDVIDAECDDGNDTDGDGCDNDCTWSCHNDPECDDGHDCTDDACNTDAHVCVFSTSPDTTLCRPLAGDCDIVDYCDGLNPDCPGDGFKDDTVECRPSAGQCDSEEYCTGLSPSCPDDSFRPDGTPCDDADPCTDPDTCNGEGACVGPYVNELHDVVFATAGGVHTCALLETGAVKCWGQNNSGQLGDGTEVDSTVPVDVSGLSSGTSVVDAGSTHTCAVLETGGVKCWGRNYYGQLGDGTTDDRSTPVDVSGLTSGGSAVAAGSSHTCALLDTGGIKCWGINNYGQLGDGTTDESTTPVDVSGLSSGVFAIGAGMYHSCALLGTGGVKCWGRNHNGQLGDGTTEDSSTPVDVSGLSSGVSAITVGSTFTCALLDTGGMKCWGSNYDGQLGDGTMDDSLTPVDVSGLPSAPNLIDAGSSHVCVILETGETMCWGYNASGQLGDGSAVNKTAPVSVVDLTSAVLFLAAGSSHTCVVLDTGGMQCWGSKGAGTLGDGKTGRVLVPMDVPGLLSGITGLSVGSYHAFAFLDAPGMKCWGDNKYGQHGDGTTVDKKEPADVSGILSGVTVISAGSRHTCALLDTGGVKCWGWNEYGQLGDGTTTDRASPVDVSGLSSGVSAIACGNTHTCAVLDTGGVKCWGRNNGGQLGNGTTTDSTTPVDASGLSSGVSEVACGGYHTCAVLDTGGMKCWGYNFWGQVGDDTDFNTRPTPVDVVDLSSDVSTAACGRDHTCAVLDTGALQCWGRNGDGQLGDGTPINRKKPVDVSGLSSGVAAVTCGGEFTCALLGTGGLKCWGYNASGQLGDGTTEKKYEPVDVSGLSSGVSAVDAGFTYTCAVLATGGVKCWGSDRYGQVRGFFSGYAHPVICNVP